MVNYGVLGRGVESGKQNRNSLNKHKYGNIPSKACTSLFSTCVTYATEQRCWGMLQLTPADHEASLHPVNARRVNEQ